jgi:hypothetical protein
LIDWNRPADEVAHFLKAAHEESGSNWK